VVLERDRRPGGLVQSESIGRYWFDRVLHLLHFSPDDPETERRIRALLDVPLAACGADAWVESRSGRVRYPFQMHLGGLPKERVVECVMELAREILAGSDRTPSDFEDQLRTSFGRAMCDEFLLPYNRKLWKRDLRELAPGDHQWTITHPDFDDVLRGALDPERSFQPYNARGYYPRPSADAPLRGMELLSQALAKSVADLRVDHEVVEIDLEHRMIAVKTPRGIGSFQWEQACVSTLPLPMLASICHPVPDALRRACFGLLHNRVYNVAICVEGPRPSETGLWSYHSDESLIWNRLIYMHAFDPESAPSGGWGIMAEITEPAEKPKANLARLAARVVDDLNRGGRLFGGRVVATRVLEADPAYVVFTTGVSEVVAALKDHLGRYALETLGRYGRWEYSSMAQVARDGFKLGDRLREESFS